MVVAVRAAAAPAAFPAAAAGVAGIRRARRPQRPSRPGDAAAGGQRADRGVAAALLHLPLPHRPRQREHPQRLAGTQPARDPVRAHPQRGRAPVAAASAVRRGRSTSGIGRRDQAGSADAGAAAGPGAGVGAADPPSRTRRQRGGVHRCCRGQRRAAGAAYVRGAAPGADLQPRHGGGGDRVRRHLSPVPRTHGLQRDRTLRAAAVRLRQPSAPGLDGRRGHADADAGHAAADHAHAVDGAGAAAVPGLPAQRERAPADRGARPADAAAQQRGAAPDPGLDPARGHAATPAAAAQPAHRYRGDGWPRRARPRAEGIGTAGDRGGLRCAAAPAAAADRLAAAAVARDRYALLVAAMPAGAVPGAAGLCGAVASVRRLGRAVAAVAAVVGIQGLAPRATHGLCAGRPLRGGTRRLVAALVAIGGDRQAAGAAADPLAAGPPLRHRHAVAG